MTLFLGCGFLLVLWSALMFREGRVATLEHDQERLLGLVEESTKADANNRHRIEKLEALNIEHEFKRLHAMLGPTARAK